MNGQLDLQKDFFKLKPKNILSFFIWINPLMQLGLKITFFAFFYLCENAQNSHTFYSIWVLFFFLWKTISMATFPWKILVADYVPCSVIANAMKAKCTPGIVHIASAVLL
jgi:hypothetical protein